MGHGGPEGALRLLPRPWCAGLGGTGRDGALFRAGCPGPASCREMETQMRPDRSVACGSWQVYCCVFLRARCGLCSVFWSQSSCGFSESSSALLSAIVTHLPVCVNTERLCLGCSSLPPRWPCKWIRGFSELCCSRGSPLYLPSPHLPQRCVQWRAPRERLPGLRPCGHIWRVEKPPLQVPPRLERNACLVSQPSPTAGTPQHFPLNCSFSSLS